MSKTYRPTSRTKSAALSICAKKSSIDIYTEPVKLIRRAGGAMLKNCSRALGLLLGVMLILQSTGCGTILYPERKGQKAGKIDVAVAALDAIGLLFFIIPGVIAFAVDFNNGTIYLPKGGKGLLNRSDLEKVRFDSRANAKANVEKALRERTGLVIRLDQDDLEVIELTSVDELPARFASASRLGNSMRVAAGLTRPARR